MTTWKRTHQDLANDVLAVLLNERDAYAVALFEHEVAADHFPPGISRALYQAVCALRMETSAQRLLDTTVAARAACEVTQVAALVGQYDGDLRANFDTLCRELKVSGQGAREIEIVSQGIQAIQRSMSNGRNTSEAIAAMMTQLRDVNVSSALPTDMASLMDRMEVERGTPPPPSVAWGVSLLDQWHQGIEPGESLCLVGEDKGRKTTVAANGILAQARSGKSVTMINLDEVPLRFARRLCAMLMAEWFWKNEMWETAGEEGTSWAGVRLNCVTRKMIRRAGKDWSTWHPSHKEAYGYAVEELKKVKSGLRIYGPAEGVTTLGALQRKVRYDMAQYGGVDAVWFDHIQKVQDYDTIFERVENSARTLSLFAQEIRVPIIYLAQRNQEAKRTGDYANGQTGIKGGGGVDSNADGIYGTIYKRGKLLDPRYLTLVAVKCRDADTPQTGYVEIHPPSGWIVPRSVSRKTIQRAEIDSYV